MSKKKGVKRINLILEKGKESERRKLEMTMLKQLEEDPQVYEKPKIHYTPQSAIIKRKNIWEDLHQEAERFQMKKIDREKTEIEMSKQPSEYTFKPNIERLNLSRYTSNVTLQTFQS